ncbi:GntR family transcriptional regulator [Methylocapsa sp. S129]|uniref:GntR family transcriptional regulator n=1 Tax=Methylocapsa sp. S129 TaxID=1641869 RepID=UPI00131A7AD8|nr:GntR family transcriptional regulator [Methylocapsa sp. S129]
MSATAISPEEKKEFPSPGRGSIAGGSRAASLYCNVLEAVVEHRLPPGAKLTEEQLGAVFGVSRTIVRSALQALAHDHIVTISRNRGAFVSAPTVADAHDVFKGRKLVEAAIAREVARQIEASDIIALRAILDEEQEAMRRGDRHAAIRLSGAFHVAVAAVCGEGVLTTFLRGLISRSSLVIALYGRGAASACGHDDHVQFLAALEARDGERAAMLMTEHLDHILGDLDLARGGGAPVDVAAVLRERLALA